MKQIRMRLLALLLALVTLTSLMPAASLAPPPSEAPPEPDTSAVAPAEPAPSAEAPQVSAPTVTVSFTAQAANAFLCAPQYDIEVSGDLAEQYGYTDGVSDGVSALDVLVRAHETVFGADFTPETAEAYLVVEQGSIRTIFGVETTNCGFLIDGAQPHSDTLDDYGYYAGYTIADAAVEDQNFLEFYLYQDEMALDYCVEFTKSKTAKLDSYDQIAGYASTLYLYGYSIGWYGCSDEATIQARRAPIEGAQLCLVDPDTGALTDIEGACSDDAGLVQLSIETAGTYLISAYVPDAEIADGLIPVILPLFELTVHEAPLLEQLELYTDQNAFESQADPIPLTPAFESGTLTGYSVTVPDYINSFFVAARLPGASEILRGSPTQYEGQTYTPMYSNQWGWSSGAYPSAKFPKGYVDFYLNHSSGKVSNYQIHVLQSATLKALAVDGTMTPGFDRDTMTYHVYADSTKDQIEITATPYQSSYTVEINGQPAEASAPYALEYAWEQDGTMEVAITVSGDDKLERTYTLVLEPEPLDDQPFIVEQPVEAAYVIGDTAAPLHLRASANGPMSYQWYSSSDGTTQNAAAIEGATSERYTPEVGQVGTVYYFCRVTNTAQSTGNFTDTAAVAVTVYPDPTPVVEIVNEIPALPDDGTTYADSKGYVYTAGETAAPLEVRCTTAAEGGTWSGYWVRSRSNPSSGGSVLDESWTLTPDTDLSVASDTGSWYYYSATYTFLGKKYRANSDLIYVYIRATSAPELTITAQPKSAEYLQGEKASNLSVSASAYGTRTYQWYENTVNSNSGGTPIEGATGASYSLGTLTDLGTKYYYCVITATLQGLQSTATSEVAAITVKEDDTPPLVIPLEGAGTQADPYQLSSADDFAAVASLVAQGHSFAGEYLTMQNDISLPKDWSGIGLLKVGASDAGNGKNILPFSGVLDGGCYTLTFAEGSRALLRYAREATVQNLDLYAPYLADYALLSNYVVDYGDDGSYNSGTGGSYVPGCPDTIDVINVTLKSGSVIRMGGFLGGSASGANVCNFTSCTVEPNVKIGYNQTTGASAGNSGVGSFAGAVNGTFRNCVSYADLYGVDHVGGIGGTKGQAMGPYSYSNCAFYGTITASGSSVGGIAGSGYNSVSAPNTPCTTIQNCIVAADLTGADKVGGILGGENGVAQNWSNAYVRSNVFTGSLHASDPDGEAGGVVGYFRSLNKTNVIEHNYYCADGVSRSIGRADYVDTSCKTHETELCKHYFDTSVELPTDPSSVTRTDLNRTDDPLGADSDALGKKVSASEMADGSLVPLLNSADGSLKNWIQSDAGYPVHSEAPVAYALEISGTYQDTYYIGDALNLDGIVFTATWSDGTQTHPTLDEADGVTVTGFDSSKRAVLTLTAAYGAAQAEFVVTVLKRPSSQDTITVYFTLLGDTLHADADHAVHTLKDDNLQTWIARTPYTLQVNATAAELFKQALADADLPYEGDENNQYKTLYITGIQIPGTQSMLSEFSNGPRSGWMYTLNGTHSENGISQQFLDNGDEIVFHYTDDYTAEQGSEKWSGSGGASASADQAAANKVIALIRAIGTVDAQSGARIEAARAAYDKLTDVQKELVTNYKALTDAEAAYTELTLGVPFQDVQGHWALEAIRYLYEQDWMDGVGENRFAPDGTLSRAMLVTILYRMEDQPAVTAASPFSDVDSQAWYADAVSWASEQGIVQGMTASTFRPNDALTREQLATLLLRYAQFRQYGTSGTADLSVYSDADAIRAYAMPAMQWAVAAGLLSGRSDTALCAQSSATRAEAAAVIVRFTAQFPS